MILPRPVLCLLCAGLLAAAASPPDLPLPQTDFYTRTVQDCRVQDLATWHHRTGDVLRKAKATISKVELCNDGKFPVFSVVLPYDPEAHTDDYFNRLYGDLAEANGWWSYALVDTLDDVVITVAVKKTRASAELELGYEHFAKS